jgi:hypothetical protein
MNGTRNDSLSGDDLARDGLKTILQMHGRALLADPRRCEALLADICPGEKRATAVLMYVLRESIPQRLLQLPAASISQSTIDQFAQKLAQEGAFPMPVDAWRWGVGSWVEALGLRVGAPQGGTIPNERPHVAPAETGRAPHPGGDPRTGTTANDDANPFAVILKPWRPIESIAEARWTIGTGLLVSFAMAATLEKLDAGSIDQFSHNLLLIACVTCVANSAAIAFPLFGYATFALGTLNVALLAKRFASNASGPPSPPLDVVVALIVVLSLVWLSFYATLRAARFLRSPATGASAKRG